MQHIKIEDIKRELFLNGPLASQMVVYEDLLKYGSGIYQHMHG
jgi:cathepsin B